MIGYVQFLFFALPVLAGSTSQFELSKLHNSATSAEFDYLVDETQV